MPRWESRLSRWPAPVAGIVAGVIGALTTDRLITTYVPDPLLVVALVIASILLRFPLLLLVSLAMTAAALFVHFGASNPHSLQLRQHYPS